MRSDELFWQDTPDSIRAAIRLEPDCWWCYMQLARMDEGSAEKLLQTSLQLNSYNSDAAIDLGLRYEFDGDLPRAEKLLLRAVEVDRTYAPRWTLANFYFRHDSMSAFWTWARRATEMPTNDIGALLELCWRASPDPPTIEANIVEENPSVLRQFVDFLINKDQVKAAVHPALRLVSVGYRGADYTVHGRSDRELLFTVIDRLIGVDDDADATLLWHELIRQHWVVADTTIPNNPQFARNPLPVSFDWNFPTYGGINSWPGSAGLITEFTGDEPEGVTIAEQTIVLPAGNYKLESSFRTQDIPPDTGIRWEISEAKWEIGDSNSDPVLASSASLSSDTLAHVAMPFSVAQGNSLLYLRLAYHRELGTARLSGTLVVPSIRIQALP